MDNIKKILESIGYTNLKDLGNEWQGLPLYRPSDNRTALVIKKNDGAFYDFVERRGGNFTELIQKTLKLKDYKDAQKILSDNGLESEIKSKDYETLIVMQKTFDKNILSRLIKKYDYWLNRGISLETIESFNGGITFYNGPMINRYVFPIFNERDDLVGFVGRILQDNTKFVKWKIMGKKSEWVFPNQSHKFIKQDKSVFLVESIGNLLSLYEIGIKNVIVTFGVNISDSIIKFLLKNDLNKIYILFDNDEEKNSVGNNSAIEAKQTFNKYFDEEQIKILTTKYKDVNEWLLQDKNGLIEFINYEKTN